MIIFLYGEDEFRSLEKLNEIRNKFLEKNSSGSGLSSFDFEEEKETKLSDIKKAFGSKGLFFEKQLIVIKNLMASVKKDFISEVVEFLKSTKNISEDKDLVVIFWEKGKTNEKNELFKFLKAGAKSQKFELLSGVKLSGWINSELKKENDKVTISPKAVEKLSAYCQGKLIVIQNEIKKLSNYKNEGIIDENDIELLVKEKINSNIFEAIEAISSGNKKLALKLLHDQLRKGEDPIYILMMYVYQFRNFLKVSEYTERGERNGYEIAKKAGLHPFVVQKILGQIHGFSPERLKKIYKKLQIIDEKVKTGKGEVKVELDRFIVEI
jgi:DNA polymerase-3 subunit delta